MARGIPAPLRERDCAWEKLDEEGWGNVGEAGLDVEAAGKCAGGWLSMVRVAESWLGRSSHARRGREERTCSKEEQKATSDILQVVSTRGCRRRLYQQVLTEQHPQSRDLPEAQDPAVFSRPRTIRTRLSTLIPRHPEQQTPEQYPAVPVLRPPPSRGILGVGVFTCSTTSIYLMHFARLLGDLGNDLDITEDVVLLGVQSHQLECSDAVVVVLTSSPTLTGTPPNPGRTTRSPALTVTGTTTPSRLGAPGPTARTRASGGGAEVEAEGR